MHYAQALDNALLIGLDTLSQNQTKSITNTKQLCDHLLKYCATDSNAGLCYHAIDIVLCVDSDASYLIIPEEKSRVAGYF